MVFSLDKSIVGFPDPRLAEEDGMLAIGGDLTPEWLELAYHYGIFPWYDMTMPEPVWYCPHERFVIFPEEIHISHSMKQLMHQKRYRVSCNEAFEQVMRNCGKAQGRDQQEGAWLGEKIIEAYTRMYNLQYALSLEVWDKEQLVGGLYGIVIGKNIIGESMFSLVPNASKLALITLAQSMQGSGGIIDCQLETPHLKSMGGRYISYDEYMEYINNLK